MSIEDQKNAVLNYFGFYSEAYPDTDTERRSDQTIDKQDSKVSQAGKTRGETSEVLSKK